MCSTIRKKFIVKTKNPDLRGSLDSLIHPQKKEIIAVDHLDLSLRLLGRRKYSFSLDLSKLVFILGGMLIPLDLLPSQLKSISSFLPFAFVSYAPAKLAVDFSRSSLLYALSGQFIYLVINIVIVFMVYKKGASILNVNGG